MTLLTHIFYRVCVKIYPFCLNSYHLGKTISEEKTINEQRDDYEH